MGPMLDPYATLGVPASATETELRAAYRRLVQLHHPDHNGGSADSARRFEAVQEAYAAVRRLRAAGGPTATGTGTGTDAAVDSRLAAMEAELRAARAQAAREQRERVERAARERAAREAAREAARDAAGDRARASDEELGYVTTDDSLGAILSDAAGQLGGRLDRLAEQARESAATPDGARDDGQRPARFADLIDELGARLTGERRDRDR